MGADANREGELRVTWPQRATTLGLGGHWPREADLTCLAGRVAEVGDFISTTCRGQHP